LTNYSDDRYRKYFLSSQTKQSGVLVKHQNYHNSVKFDTDFCSTQNPSFHLLLEFSKCTDPRIKLRFDDIDSLLVLTYVIKL